MLTSSTSACSDLCWFFFCLPALDLFIWLQFDDFVSNDQGSSHQNNGYSNLLLYVRRAIAEKYMMNKFKWLGTGIKRTKKKHVSIVVSSPSRPLFMCHLIVWARNILNFLLNWIVWIFSDRYHPTEIHQTEAITKDNACFFSCFLAQNNDFKERIIRDLI